MGDEQVEPEMHDSVAVFFCDIVGYTELCGRLSPEKASIVFTMMHTSPRISCIKQTKKLNFVTNMFVLTPDLVFVETQTANFKVSNYAWLAFLCKIGLSEWFCNQLCIFV